MIKLNNLTKIYYVVFENNVNALVQLTRSVGKFHTKKIILLCIFMPLVL